MKTRTAEAMAVVIVIAIIVYGIVPLLVSTSPGSMKSGNTYYIEGRIVTETESANVSVFVLDTGSGNVSVYYHGIAPSVGSYVLVKGTYRSLLFIDVFDASNVYYWLYIL
ncbi:hypothetical protein [Thermoplasma sp.]|uniref:hypothetical protein n=1 Tax=Thermoplasma sp. TaxID=1973142 RepID=UPI001275351C|nr:hypothetical protein [Thermoplasma sp.]KAA8921940.1 MAG: hypothetical protein F6Q11_06930 [Thermoplasma sp.]